MSMHDDEATNRRPPIRRRAGSRAADSVPLTRAERLLTVREVARMLCVSPTSVYMMIRRGELRAVYVRQMVRLFPAAVADYMEVYGSRVLRRRESRRRK